MSNVQNLGFICAVITVAVVFIAYITPYWSVYEDHVTGKRASVGLLVHCEPDKCGWLLSNKDVRNAMPGKNVFFTRMTRCAVTSCIVQLQSACPSFQMQWVEALGFDHFLVSFFCQKCHDLSQEIACQFVLPKAILCHCFLFQLGMPHLLALQ